MAETTEQIMDPKDRQIEFLIHHIEVLNHQIEVLKHNLLAARLQLKSVRLEKDVEARKNKELHDRFMKVMKLTCQERDQYKDQFQSLILNRTLPSNSQLGNIKSSTLPSTVQYDSSIATTPNSISKSTFAAGSSSGSQSDVESIIGAVSSSEFFSITPTNSSINSTGFVHMYQDGDSVNKDQFFSNRKYSNCDPVSEAIDIMIKGKPLPQVGKLKKAVMDAGPLLQDLLYLDPELPKWNNPPNLQQHFKLPPPPPVAWNSVTVTSNYDKMKVPAANSSSPEMISNMFHRSLCQETSGFSTKYVQGLRKDPNTNMLSPPAAAAVEPIKMVPNPPTLSSLPHEKVNSTKRSGISNQKSSEIITDCTSAAATTTNNMVQQPVSDSHTDSDIVRQQSTLAETNMVQNTTSASDISQRPSSMSKFATSSCNFSGSKSRKNARLLNSCASMKINQVLAGNKKVKLPTKYS